MSSPADGRRGRIPQSHRMTYIISTDGPGDEATFHKVGDLVGGRPDGLIALYGGASANGLSITAVWESKTHADRFTAAARSRTYCSPRPIHPRRLRCPPSR